MSLITSCPSCQTQFVVSDAQLEAYGGKVRCGSCNHVFNAKNPKADSPKTEKTVAKDSTNKPVAETPKKQKVIRKPVESTTQKVSAQATTASKPVSVNIQSTTTKAATTTKPTNKIKIGSTTATQASAAIKADVKPKATSDTEKKVSEPRTEITTLVDDLLKDDTVTDEIEITAGHDSTEINDELEQLSGSKPRVKSKAEPAEKPKVRQKKKTVSDTSAIQPEYSPDFERRTSNKSKWILLLICLALLLVLLSQLIYFMRPKISAYFPQTKPFLEKVCAKMNCKVELPKELDLLTIEDSDMQEHTKYLDILQFSSTLVNHADYAQSYPVLELTLTDANDESVVRRTFEAKDYLNKDVAINNGISAHEEVRIKLNLKAPDQEVTGYRVNLRY